MEASFEVKRQKGREKKSKRAGDRQKHTHTHTPQDSRGGRYAEVDPT